MLPERWQQVKQLYCATLEHQPEERLAFLMSSSDEHPEVVREVRTLLDADRPTGSLSQGLRIVAAEVMAGMEAVVGKATPPQIPQRIGPYKVLQEVGRGGVSIVYLALRDDRQFRKRVAIKVLRRGMDSDDVLDRFQQERQILASLEHPNIARLLDAGNDPEGRPYFVMDHVEGLPIDRYCDEARQSIRQRLELFVTVCSAVEHSHRNLIIHRDLKPSNILITAAGVPRLLDFGIAKIINPELGGMRPLTVRPRQHLMTPAYASPEQVRGEPVQLATDVYALGVLLHELLTGRRPYQITSSSAADIERVICETHPPAPSSLFSKARRHSGDTSLDQAAIQRHTTARRLHHRLRGDLDLIVLKALRKEPSRRYTSVTQLSSDLKRYLAGWPVRAQRPTVGYRAGKFLRRHRAVVLAAILVALALLSGTAIALWQAREAMIERGAARQAQQLAEQLMSESKQQQARAEQVTAFLVDLFKVSDPFQGSAEQLTARAALDQGVQRLDSSLHNQPLVRAALLDAIGQTYSNLGDDLSSQKLLREALTLRDQNLPPGHAEIAASNEHLGHTLLQSSEFEAASHYLVTAVHQLRALDDEASPELATSLHDLADVNLMQGHYDEAESLFTEALAMRRQQFGESSPQVADTLAELASLSFERGEYDQAEQLWRQALLILRQRFGDHHPRTARLLLELGQLSHIRGQPAKSEQLLTEALAIQRATLGEKHPGTAATMNSLAIALQKQGRLAEAETIMLRALKIRRQVFQGDHPAIASSLNTVALLYQEQGRLREAADLLAEAQSLYGRIFGEQHPWFATVLANRALLECQLGKIAKAEQLYRQVVALRRANLPADHPDLAVALQGLGAILVQTGRPAEAEPLLREGLAIVRARLEPNHDIRIKTEQWLATCLRDLGRAEEVHALQLIEDRDLTF